MSLCSEYNVNNINKIILHILNGMINKEIEIFFLISVNKYYHHTFPFHVNNIISLRTVS